MKNHLLVASLLLIGFNTAFAQSRNVGIESISVIELGAHDTSWIGTNGQGVTMYNSTTRQGTTFDISNTPLTSDTITAVLHCNIAGGQYVFVGSKTGLVRYRNNTWDTLTHLTGQNITGILKTGGDSLWVLTATSGAFIFDSTGDNFLGSFNTGNSAIPTDLGSTVQRGSTSCGSYAFGTTQKGCFWVNDGTKFNLIDTSAAGKRLVDNRVTALYMKNDCSARLIGTMGGYSSCPPGLPCTNFTTTEGLPQNYITAIGEDCKGKIWLGTHDSGIIIYNPRINATSKFIDVFDSIHRTSYGLSKANNGLMYGINTEDGIKHQGMFYYFDPVLSTGNSIYQFDSAVNNFWNPVGNPAAMDTLIWGVTRGGGSKKLGTIFRYSTVTGTFILYSRFDTLTGGPPTGVIAGTNRNLYGTTGSCPQHPYGTLIKYTQVPSRITMVVDFDSTVKGAYPDFNLKQAGNGVIYGCTPVGGVNNKGTLFQFNTIDSSYTKLYDFQGTVDGEYPSGPVIRGSDGLLYGTTQKGGSSGNGVLFSFDSIHGTINKIHEFNLALSTPIFLYQAANGIFYGLTQGVTGALFQYNRYNGAFNVLHVFNGLDGIGTMPYPNMSENPQGSVFGRTVQGGSIGLGTVFQFDPKYQEFKKYNTGNGLGSNQVTAIALDPATCDSSGVFIGTRDGNIVRVDTSGNVIPVSVINSIKTIRAEQVGVYLYPQPATSEVNFVFNRQLATGTVLSIFDISGRKLKQYSIGNEALFTVDVSSLVSGIYFYSLTKDDTVLATGKVAVVRQ